MSAEDKAIGQIAMNVVTKGERDNIGKLKYGVDFREFGKYVGIWIITALILFGALIIITIVKGSSKIIQDTISEVDTLNMMFSLVLSALLEQIWTKSSSGWLYSVTLGAEGVLTVIGGMLFMAYSIVRIIHPENELMQLSFALNIIYIIVSVLVVILGFVSRAIHERV